MEVPRAFRAAAALEDPSQFDGRRDTKHLDNDPIKHNTCRCTSWDQLSTIFQVVFPSYGDALLNILSLWDTQMCVSLLSPRTANNFRYRSLLRQGRQMESSGAVTS